MLRGPDHIAIRVIGPARGPRASLFKLVGVSGERYVDLRPVVSDFPLPYPMRKGLLWLSEQPKIFNFVRSNPLARRFASRFVAGETVDTAIEAVRSLNPKGITASLDLLGESVTQESEAASARDIYLGMLDRIAETGVNSNVSLKLTQMGFDISEDLCLANMRLILDKAKALNTFVRLDMEGSDYTQRYTRLLFRETLRALRQCFRGSHPVLPAALAAGHRSADRDEGPGPTLQGSLSRTARRWRFPTRRMSIEPMFS